MEIKQAEAAKKAAIGRNDAQKEVALSNAELAVTQANADKQAGEATANRKLPYKLHAKLRKRKWKKLRHGKWNLH